MQISPKEELISSTISSLSNHHLPIAPYTKLGFTSLHTVNKNKPYIPYSDCVLKHILHSLDLTNQEKLFYLIADSLSLISGQNATKKRAAALPATKWAKNLNCSKNEIFTMQKSLEAKGYFIVVRDKNEFGKNQRNIITPSFL